MKILLTEQNQTAGSALRELLERKSFRVDAVCHGEAAMEKIARRGYHILILDTAVPGLDVMRTVRQQQRELTSNTVVVLTDSADPQDRIAFLNAGADCCLSKPADPLEVLACINSLLRRQGTRTEKLRFGNTTLDMDTVSLRCGQKSLRLTDKELKVMRNLLQSGERIIAKEAILSRVWGLDKSDMENHVEVYVGFLRKKLTAIGSNIRIKSDRRLGYHLETAAE